METTAVSFQEFTLHLPLPERFKNRPKTSIFKE